jgi:serine phosphatase RsbU (regulator of sigma subunit)
MLPEKSEIVKFLPNFFIFYKPRDIVSGDFYWIHQIENSNKSNSNNIERQITIIAVADCTGHGVPGAFMSMIGNELLNDIVISRTIISPELILQNLHIGIRHALQQQKSENQDGMDISVVTLHKNSQNPQKTHKIDYAGAMNPFYMVSNEILEKENELEVGKTVALIIEKQQNSYFYEVKADKKPVGGKQIEEERIFTKHSFLCKSNTKITIYLFSDGYQDQFGGQDGKKFMVKKFKELLQTISSETIKKQELILAETFEKWKINTKQVDDVLVLGIEI